MCIVLGVHVNFMLCRNLGVVDLGQRLPALETLGIGIVLGSRVNFMLSRNLGVVDLGKRFWAHVSNHALSEPRCRGPGLQ